MPGGDGTGPAGLGPMTGRAAGYCAGYPVPGYMNPIGGRGYWGWGRRGGGFGWRNWYYATGLTGWQRAALGYPPAWGPPVYPQDREREMDALKNQAKYFENALKEINKRIEELSKETGNK